MEKVEILEKRKFSPEIISELVALTKRSNWYNWFSILLDWGIISAIIALNLYYSSIILYIISIIIIGGRMRGLDNLMHEASHNLLFRNRFLNRWVACILIGFPVFLTISSYRSSHLKHHKYLWTDKDPDTSRLKKMGLATRPGENNLSFLFNYFFVPFFTRIFFQNIADVFRSLFNPKGQNRTEFILKLVFWGSIVFLSIWFGFWKILIIYYLIPFFTIFQMIRLWSDIADHSGLETKAEIFASRNSYGSLLERFILFPHHDTYHIVHHLFPSIPHYNLHKAHLILLQDPEYRKANHCAGAFIKLVPGIPSVLRDLSREHSNNLIGKD